MSRYLHDARAIAATPELPSDLRNELIATCCRSALEAASQAKIRSVRLGRGEPNRHVDEVLTSAHSTHQLMTLAVFDDPDRAPDLLRRLNQEGPWAADALQACRQGAHFGAEGDLRWLIRDANRLAEWVQR